MGLFSTAKLFGMTIRESATDGSDFTNPDADYRRLFLGEDGELHLKDSAGTVTDVSGAGGDVATDAIWDAKGDLAVGTGANTAQKLTVGTNGYVLTADSAETTGLKWAAASGTANIVPPIVQEVTNYQASSTTNAVTVAVATEALIVVVQSETRGASSITQTNVTWTRLYTGSSSSLYVEVWTGAITGAAGTTCTVNFASATKSQITFIEVDVAPLTAAGTAVTATNGEMTLSGETVGSLCIFAECSFNANTSYTICTVPHAPLNWGGCLAGGLFYFVKSRVATKIIQSSTVTRFDAVMRLS